MWPKSNFKMLKSKRYHVKVILKNSHSRYDFIHSRLASSNRHLIRHLSHWERKGWNNAWSSLLIHRSQFVRDNFRQQNPAQKLLCERSHLRIYRLTRQLEPLCTAFQVNPYFHKSTALLVDFLEIATLPTLFNRTHFEVNDFQPR